MSYLRNSTSLLSSLCCLLMTFCMMARSSAVRWDMSGLVDVVLVPLPTTGGVPPRPTPPPEEKGAADAPTVTDEWGTLIKLRVCSQKNAILSTNCLFFKRCGYILICKTLTQTLKASIESSYRVLLSAFHRLIDPLKCPGRDHCFFKLLPSFLLFLPLTLFALHFKIFTWMLFGVKCSVM